MSQGQKPAQSGSAPIFPPSLPPGTPGARPEIAGPKGPGAADAQTATPVDARWMCEMAKANPDESAGGRIDQPLTVGEKFVLTCEGESVSIDVQKLALKLSKEEKYTLKILRLQTLNANKGVFTATSYKVGESKPNDVVITDGNKAIALDGIKIEVKSVIDPQTNPEGKPFAPADPVMMPLPMWLWISLAVILVLVCGIILRVWRRSSQRKQLLAELANNSSALSPYNQFNKDLRTMNREYPLVSQDKWTPAIAGNFVDEIDKSFRWYLAREFTVPAFKWTPRMIARELKKKDRKLYKQVERDLFVALRELRRGKQAREKLSAVDGQQIIELCRNVADRVNHYQRETKP